MLAHFVGPRTGLDRHLCAVYFLAFCMGKRKRRFSHIKRGRKKIQLDSQNKDTVLVEALTKLEALTKPQATQSTSDVYSVSPVRATQPGCQTPSANQPIHQNGAATAAVPDKVPTKAQSGLGISSSLQQNNIRVNPLAGRAGLQPSFGALPSQSLFAPVMGFPTSSIPVYGYAASSIGSPLSCFGLPLAPPMDLRSYTQLLSVAFRARQVPTIAVPAGPSPPKNRVEITVVEEE